MAEANVEQGTSTNGAHGEQIAGEAETRQPSPEMPGAEPLEGHPAGRSRGKIIACLALAGGGAFAAIRRARRAKASHQRRRRWPVLPVLRARSARSCCQACGARTRKLRSR
jgi:hypothetical protein